MRSATLLLATALSLSSTAAAQEPANVQTAGEALTACYMRAAASYGAKTCQRPDAIVQAVFAYCEAQEQNLSSAAQTAHGDLAYDFGDKLVAKTRELMSARIQRGILDAQIKSRRCR